MKLFAMGRGALMLLAAGALAAVLPALAGSANAAGASGPTTSADLAVAPTTQDEGGPTPPEARAMLSLIEQAGADPGNTRDPRAMMEYSLRLNQAEAAMKRLKKEYPEVAGRAPVRIADLNILFDASRLREDTDMKDLRQAAAAILADPAAPRSLRAMADYHLLNADVFLRATKEPASQPDAMPAWAGQEMDRRIKFARQYKDEPIAAQAFGQAIMYKDEIDGYDQTKPLIAEFITLFAADKATQATLLAELAKGEYFRNRDGWVKAQPIADRLMSEYRDQPVTPQVLSLLALGRVQTDPKGGQEMVDQLTKDFPGDEAVARVWGELAMRDYTEKKNEQVAQRLKVLAEKFPDSEGRITTLASLAWQAYRQNGLEAVLGNLNELQQTFPNSPLIGQLSVAIAQSQMEKVGYEKAAGFVGGVLKKYAGTEEGRRLAEFVRQQQSAASQPAGPLSPAP